MSDQACPTGPRTVLLVEDNDIYRQIVSAALKRRFEGWQILTAASVAEGRDQISGQHLDVVVTDLGLPDGSGTDLVAPLSEGLARGTKLVALSNESPQDVWEGLVARGYHGYVSKEHGVQALGNVVLSVLQGGAHLSQPLG